MILKKDVTQEQFGRLIMWTMSPKNHWLYWVDEDAATRGPLKWHEAQLVTVLNARGERGGVVGYHVELEVREHLEVSFHHPNPSRANSRPSLSLGSGDANSLTLHSGAAFPTPLPYYLARRDERGDVLYFTETSPYLTSMLGAIAGRTTEVE